MKNIALSDHFTYGKLIRFALPTVVMMIFTSIYWVVDGFFVSNFAGKTEFASLNFIFPFIQILSSVGFMIGTGGCALIGKLLGENRRDDANRCFSMFVYMSIIIGVFIGIAGFFLIRPAALFLGCDEMMLDHCVMYGRISMIGTPAVILQYEFQSMFVVAEKPKYGLYVTISAGCANMLLDALLVGVFSLGVKGAAIATVCSQCVGGFVPVIYFARKNGSLLSLGSFYFNTSHFFKALSNGLSEFVENISISVISMIYNAQLIRLAGENGVAAYGVMMYVCFVFVGVFVGYSVGTAPLVSYHFGAKNRDELKNLLKKSSVIILSLSLIMLSAGELLSFPLSHLYVGYDKNLMDMTLHAFHIFSLSFLFCGIPIYCSSFFTALNDGLTSAMISFFRTLVFQVLFVLLLPLIFGLDGIWLSLVVAELFAALLGIFFLFVKRKKYGYM